MVTLIKILLMASLISYEALVVVSSQRPCPGSMFGCLGGRCITKKWLCDGYDDCGDADRSDERNCQQTTTTTIHATLPTTTTTNISGCLPNQIVCPNTMRCIFMSDICNNRNDCGDNMDEMNCAGATTQRALPCGVNQFTCPSNRKCIDNILLCNGAYDCEDQWDEQGCSPTTSTTTRQPPTTTTAMRQCGRNEVRCFGGTKCLLIRQLCDNNFNCGESEWDETNCPQLLIEACENVGGLMCYNTTKCVLKEEICDGYQKCPDNSDEINCPCQDYQYKCAVSGVCINKGLLCDGIKDCSQGDDEDKSKCLQCRADQFRCKKSGMCLPSEARCNGTSECSDMSDELSCLSMDVSGLLSSVYKGQPAFLICANGWTDQHSHAACRNMGHSNSTGTNIVGYSTAKALTLVNEALSTGYRFMSNFKSTPSCPDNQVVQLSCYVQECGKRDSSFDYKDSYVINGNFAKQSAWPWFVQVQTKLKVLSSSCGGSILNERWILTAAHCVWDQDGIVDSTDVDVIAGTNTAFDPNKKMIKVQEIKTFQYNDDTVVNDWALLKLAEPLMFNKSVQPICLADPNVVESYDVCVALGYGRTDPFSGSSGSRLLKEGRMDLMSASECESNFQNAPGKWEHPFDHYVSYDRQVCAGSTPTYRGTNTCEGDSGGPLVCRNSRLQWTQVGVVSKGMDLEFSDCYLSLFTRVSYYYNQLMAAMK